MSQIQRLTSFPLAGAVSWRIGAPPPWRGYVPRATPSDAVLADPVVWTADFSVGVYARAGAAAALGAVLATARSSPAIMQGADGLLHSFGNDQPPVLPGTGLDLRGQVVNLAFHSEKFSNWVGQNSAATDDAVTSPLGTSTGGSIATGTSNVRHGRDSNNITFANATVYTLSVYAKAGTHRYAQLVFGGGAFGSNAYANFDLQDGIVGTVGSSATAGLVPLAGGWYRLWITATTTAGASTIAALYLVQSAAAARNEAYVGTGTVLHAFGGQVNAGALAPYVPTGGAASATRLATDCSVPDFAALVAAGGLQDGFTATARVALASLSASAPRAVFSMGADADNCVTLLIGTDNVARLIVRKAGADEVVLAASAFSSAGEKEIAISAVPGAWSIAATGVTGDASADAETLPSLDVCRIGSRFGGVNYLGGVLLDADIARAA
jgi:hypothetical protein